jgi:hypothetical protein
MASSPNNTSTKKTPDEGSWIHGCFVVKIGAPFEDYKALLEYSLADEIYGKTKPVLHPAVKKMLEDKSTEGYSDKGYTPPSVYLSKRKFRDSSLGGNDAINPLPQFSLDDDIAFPMYSDKTGQVNMGQVYSEHYDDLQQVLYLGFGIPVFSNVGGFWATATDVEFSKFINHGSGITKEKIGYLIGSAPIRVIQMATIPFKFIGAMIDSLQQVPISKYYSFSSQMPMYFRFVNTILAMLATNMGIVGSSEDLPTTGSKSSGESSIKLLDGFYEDKNNKDLSGISSVFRESGLDIARIMLKRFYYENGDRKIHSKRWTDNAIFESVNTNNGKGVLDDTQPSESTNTQAASDTTAGNVLENLPNLRKWTLGWFDNFTAAFGSTLYDGHLFIGFRIDKGMGGSESFSNSTGESQIARIANEKFEAGKNASYETMNNNIGEGAIGSIIESAISGVKGLIAGIASTVNLDPLAASTSGAARINVPDVWMSSSYSRSQSFSITCMSPYGDFESIFQSEYVPLACMLAGALPRGTGLSSHAAPFVCQAYCRGIFASPICMIESLEVTRGADQFGMNNARLPLKLTMNVTLKDLSPVMYMSMGGDRGLVNAMFGTDDNFAEYMMTLSGMGLKDRLNPYRAAIRRVKQFFAVTYHAKMSPYVVGMSSGSNNIVARGIAMVIGAAGRNLPGN